MRIYSVIRVIGREHVLSENSSLDTSTRMKNNLPGPNYLGTGKALIGIIEKGDTLEIWKRKHCK
jgi:hypothetical protein